MDDLERSEASLGELLRWARSSDVLRGEGDHVADLVVGFGIAMTISVALVVLVGLEDFGLAVLMKVLEFLGLDRGLFVGNA